MSIKRFNPTYVAGGFGWCLARRSRGIRGLTLALGGQMQMERIESLPRSRELRAEPAMAPLVELRSRLGRGLSDEELLLRATMPATQVDAMRAAGPAPRHYDPEAKPVMELLRRVLRLRNVAELSVVKPDFKLELHGRAGSRALPA